MLALKIVLHRDSDSKGGGRYRARYPLLSKSVKVLCAPITNNPLTESSAFCSTGFCAKFEAATTCFGPPWWRNRRSIASFTGSPRFASSLGQFKYVNVVRRCLSKMS